MNKETLVKLIDDAINIAKIKQKTEIPRPLGYKRAIFLLEDMKQEVITDTPPNKKQNLAVGLGQYAVKEVDLYDEDYASILCKVSIHFSSNLFSISGQFISISYLPIENQTRKLILLPSKLLSPSSYLESFSFLLYQIICPPEKLF